MKLSQTTKRAAVGIGILIIMSAAVIANMDLFAVSENGITGLALCAVCTAVCALCAGIPHILGGKAKKAASIALFLIIPAVNLYMTYFMTDFTGEGLIIHLCNIVFYYALSAALLIIIPFPAAASAASAAVCALIMIINSVVMKFRGVPIGLSDIYSLKTAIGVAGHYSFELSVEIITGIYMLAAEIGLCIRLFAKFPKKRYISLSGAALFVIFALLAANVPKIDNGRYVKDRQTDYETLGFAYSVFADAKSSSIHGVSHEDAENAREILSEYSGDSESESYPNIIVIMNESFSDLANMSDAPFSDTVTPFWDSIEYNTVSGELLVSVYGGLTCNTEFEFLTGMSMYNLPMNTTPFMQYINGEIPSIASHLKSEGYYCIGMHPYWDKSWDRDKVYPLLGFDSFIAAKSRDELSVSETNKSGGSASSLDYSMFGGTQGKLLRGYMSDRANYEKIIELYENKEPGTPLFIFNVTVQNHGNYDDAEYENSIYTGDYEGQYPLADQYFSLLHESDEAFYELIEYFNRQTEPTIILMFGDHQPSIEQEFYDKYVYPHTDYDDKELLKYIVPFKIVANFDIGTEYMGLISPNYLSGVLLDTANVSKSGFQNLAKAASEQAEAMCSFGYFTSTRRFVPRDWDNEEEHNIVEDYGRVQQYLLFGEED